MNSDTSVKFNFRIDGERAKHVGGVMASAGLTPERYALYCIYKVTLEVERERKRLRDAGEDDSNIILTL